MKDPVRTKQAVDDIRIFVELSGHEFDRKKLLRILQLAQANCTAEMMAEDMDIDEQEAMDYLTIMRCKGLVGLAGEEG